MSSLSKEQLKELLIQATLELEETAEEYRILMRILNEKNKKVSEIQRLIKSK